MVTVVPAAGDWASGRARPAVFPVAAGDRGTRHRAGGLRDRPSLHHLDRRAPGALRLWAQRQYRRSGRAELLAAVGPVRLGEISAELQEATDAEATATAITGMAELPSGTCWRSRRTPREHCDLESTVSRTRRVERGRGRRSRQGEQSTTPVPQDPARPQGAGSRCRGHLGASWRRARPHQR